MKIKVRDKVYNTVDDIVLDSFKNRKLTSLVKVPIIAIYKSPRDYPGMYIARLWDINEKPTKYVVVNKSLKDIRKAIPVNMTRIEKQLGEDNVIVESYI